MNAVLDAAGRVPAETWGVLVQMAPYLLLGFLASGALSVVVSPALIERKLGRRGLGSVFLASALGVPLPLCSCGVIPVAASIRRSGASRGATTSFLISTPQTGVDSILATWSLLGPVFAVVRPVLAFASGILGGALADLVDRGEEAARGCPVKCEGACLAPGEGPWPVRALRYALYTLPSDIARPLVIGLVVAGVLGAVLPEDYFRESLGGEGLAASLLAMLVIAAVAIPVYVCATASIPVASALVAAGLSPGAALVFLVLGPATNAATIATVWKTLGRRTALVYLGTVASTAFAAGLALDLAVGRDGIRLPALVEHAHHHAAAGPDWLGIASAAALAAILVAGLAGPTVAAMRARAGGGADVAGSVRVRIAGMTCGHCAAAVKRALEAVEGVKSAEVDLSAGAALVRGEGLKDEALREAVEGVGYEVKGVERVG